MVGFHMLLSYYICWLIWTVMGNLRVREAAIIGINIHDCPHEHPIHAPMAPFRI